MTINLAAHITQAICGYKLALQDGGIVVVTDKVISTTLTWFARKFS